LICRGRKRREGSNCKWGEKDGIERKCCQMRQGKEVLQFTAPKRQGGGKEKKGESLRRLIGKKKRKNFSTEKKKKRGFFPKGKLEERGGGGKKKIGEAFIALRRGGKAEEGMRLLAWEGGQAGSLLT